MLAGVAVFERQVYSVGQALDRIQDHYFPNSPPIEFHATSIRSGDGFWRGVDKETRGRIMREIGVNLREAHQTGLVLFGAVVEKTSRIHGEEAVLLATEQICKRFDTFLKRRENDNHDPQRGLVVFAEGRFHQRARLWVRDFKKLGTQWGVLTKLCDIPYFASTRETRLLQVADYVAHATYLNYEKRYAEYFDVISSRFDSKDGVVHGLVHYLRDPGAARDCSGPACRRSMTR